MFDLNDLIVLAVPVCRLGNVGLGDGMRPRVVDVVYCLPGAAIGPTGLCCLAGRRRSSARGTLHVCSFAWRRRAILVSP